jgi:hypothetical protein
VNFWGEEYDLLIVVFSFLRFHGGMELLHSLGGPELKPCSGICEQPCMHVHGLTLKPCSGICEQPCMHVHGLTVLIRCLPIPWDPDQAHLQCAATAR